MQMIFRMDCPKCKWGHEVKASYINQGFLKGKCKHCKNDFYFKITVMGIKIEVEQERPEYPCNILDEAK